MTSDQPQEVPRAGDFCLMRGEFAGINDTAASGLIVRSLRPHWGAGGRVSPAISTDNSRNLTPAAPPAIECNVYHCTQSTRRRLTFVCSVGVRQPTYHELTIWGKTEGTAFSHAFAADWDTQEPWGNLDLRFDASRHVPDGDKYRLAVDREAEIRLVRGFSLSLSGSASRVRNQMSLSAEGATGEKVLLRRCWIAAGYNDGFSYTFDSVFNNVVDARLSAF